MSASWPGSMRDPRVKTPLLLLLLLLLTLTGTVLCQRKGNGTDPAHDTNEEEAGDGDTETPEPLPTDFYASSAGVKGKKNVTEEHGSGQGRSFGVNNSTSTPEEGTEEMQDKKEEEEEEEEGLSPTIILIPVVLVVAIISIIVCSICISRRWSKKARNQELQKEDPYFDGSSTEKVPMPMFEEDVPSVLELEMEELDQWMQKDGETAEDAKHA